jgi:hypothetical protein
MVRRRTDRICGRHKLTVPLPREIVRLYNLTQANGFAELRLTELTVEVPAVETTGVVYVENKLRAIVGQEQLLAVNFVADAEVLLHHGNSDLIATVEHKHAHDKTVAHAAAFGNVSSA